MVSRASLFNEGCALWTKKRVIGQPDVTGRNKNLLQVTTGMYRIAMIPVTPQLSFQHTIFFEYFNVKD